MLIAQRAFSHVGELDSTLRAGVHEPVAALRVELGRSDDLCQLLHIGRFDINDVEALILDIQVPKIYSQVIAADECFSIAVD